MPYIYEFLYRGGEEPAWHLILKDPVSNVETMYNIAQAQAAGYSLPSILSSIDTSTLTELEKARALLQEYADAGVPLKEPAPSVEVATETQSPGLTLMQRVASFLGL